MDLVASCKDKLAYFRIKELKDVLTQLGLSKQGKKQDLVDRILAVLSDERVSGTWAKKNAVGKEDIAKLVDDTYRKMQVSGAPDLASKSQAVSESSNVKFKEEVGKLKEEVGKLKEEAADSYQMEKIRCTCGSALQSESMIKCEDPRCHVWQHINCVIIPEKPMEGLLPNPPEVFYCELCRLSRADPFWMTISNPLYPVKMCITNCPADGTNPVQNVEKNFQLTRADKDLLLKQEYDVQAWCMLLNDKVPFRMQWPQYADLQINGVPVRAINRPGSQLLGANGRDDGPIITGCTRDGINKFSLTGCDARVFCIGVRIVKRRTVQQILNMIPKETEGELFEDALARVRRCVGGGTATENADSDSDLEVVADFFPVNLRCPMSGSRMKIPGRFKPCIHMGCFDLEVFVEMNQRSRKWQCPICLKNYALENIIIDPYFNQITSKLLNCAEDVTEIEVKPDGSWRAKLEGDRRTHGELALWHLPDGTLSPLTEAESKPKQEIFQQIKQEYGSESHAGLKLGMKKNPNGIWEIRQPNDALNFHSGNLLEEKFQNVIPMSSSATGSGGDDASVNQNGSGGTTMTGIEFDSVPMNIDTSAYGHAPSGEPVVIVLSDSEEENEEPFNSNSIPFSGIPDSYQDNVPLGLFNTTNDDDFGMHMWSLPPNGPGGPGGASFQLFGSEAEVTDNLVGPDYTMGIPESSVERANNEMTGGLVDNPLAFSNDPALQIFLPTRPSYLSTTHADLPDQGDMSNGVRNEEDLITLTLGGGGGGGGGGGLGGGGQGDPMSSNGINSGHQSRSKDGAMDSVADTASLLVNMSGDNSNSNNRLGKTSREMSDSLFQFPRQRRSVRPRLYLSIDSDSE